jgi:hypothetical protein
MMPCHCDLRANNPQISKPPPSVSAPCKNPNASLRSSTRIANNPRPITTAPLKNICNLTREI